MCHRGCFRQIYIRNVLCKKEDNNKKHVINEYEIMKELRDKLKNELEGLDKKTINLNLLEILNIFIILRIIQERKKKRKRIIKELEKLKKFIQ